MCTGVHSSVVLQALPLAEGWQTLGGRKDWTVTVSPLCDGRVHVACFAPVFNDRPDLMDALRVMAAEVKLELERLHG